MRPLVPWITRTSPRYIVADDGVRRPYACGGVARTASHAPSGGQSLQTEDGGDFFLVDLIFSGLTDHELEIERHGRSALSDGRLAASRPRRGR